MPIQKQIQEIRIFNRFYTDLIGLLDNHLLNSDYSLAEARILYEIYIGKEISASTIITKLNIDKGYLSRILKKFDKKGLIAKTVWNDDARVSLISLTGKGVKVFNSLNDASNQQIDSLIGSFPEQQLNDLVQHMNAIMAILKKPKNGTD
jgi:DNA-binding MarR family transcriptional regulator